MSDLHNVKKLRDFVSCYAQPVKPKKPLHVWLQTELHQIDKTRGSK